MHFDQDDDGGTVPSSHEALGGSSSEDCNTSGLTLVASQESPHLSPSTAASSSGTRLGSPASPSKHDLETGELKGRRNIYLEREQLLRSFLVAAKSICRYQHGRRRFGCECV